MQERTKILAGVGILIVGAAGAVGFMAGYPVGAVVALCATIILILASKGA